MPLASFQILLQTQMNLLPLKAWGLNTHHLTFINVGELLGDSNWGGWGLGRSFIFAVTLLYVGGYRRSFFFWYTIKCLQDTWDSPASEGESYLIDWYVFRRLIEKKTVLINISLCLRLSWFALPITGYSWARAPRTIFNISLACPIKFTFDSSWLLFLFMVTLYLNHHSNIPSAVCFSST